MTTGPQRYRHRSEEVEAVQWTGDNADALRAFAGPDFEEIDLDDRTEDPEETAAVREAEHGTWRGLKPGDWVVRLDGGLYEFAAADFAKQYEPAPAAPVAAPPTGQAELRERIAGVLRPHANLGGAPPRYELPLFDGATPSLPRISGWWALDDVVDAVMAMLRGCTLRELELLHRPNTTPSRPEPYRTATAESHRLALSTALGLGTSAPWDAIRERAAELARQPVAVDRAAVLQEAADEAERVAESLRAHHEFERSTGALDVMTELRRLAAEAPSDCPGYETSPNRCACPCVGCRHNCAAHQAAAFEADSAGKASPKADSKAEKPPVCEGFQWIGQSFATCERCDQPAWDHVGEEVAVAGAGPFDTRRTVRPWKPGEADRIRAKWGTPATAPAVVAEPGKENDADRIVAYRSDSGRLIHCLQHVPPPAARHADFHPVASEDLPDGGICTYPECGVDVLAQQPKEA